MKAKLLLCISTLGTISSLCCAANVFPLPQTSEELAPVSTVVSVEAKRGKDVPAINKEDVRVMQGHNRLQVAEWFPVQGEHAALEVLILIDEAASPTVANQFDDLRKFMSAQPSTTAVAVGYSEYGSLRMAQDFTTDHEAAGKALRIPMGMFGGESSPYLAVSDAIKHWHDTKARRAILMVSDGVDPLQPGIADTYLDAAVEDAQRAGVQVSAIFASAAGHFGHSFWRISRGQDDLSQLTEKTGGESYFQGFSTPVSFAPFLDEFADRLGHQYLLRFLIKPEKKPSYQHVKLETEVPNAELVGPDQVYVAAPK
jgi:hypothetical protein